MRGEDALAVVSALVIAGSPPHARGRRDDRFEFHPFVEDHPRMRGEDSFGPVLDYGFSGSPPHARGRPSHRPRHNPHARITPACAGKTTKTLTGTPRWRDHPRMRGEDRGTRNVKYQALGSPPHARGRLHMLYADPAPFRITPACAGKTSQAFFAIGSSADHPRMRGEDLGARRVGGRWWGSPPHARGRP